MTSSERIRMVDEAIKLLRVYRRNHEICTDREALDLLSKVEDMVRLAKPDLRDNPIYSY